MIRRPTVVYITILLAAATVYLYLNYREPSAEPEATAGPDTQVSYIFPPGQGDPTGIVMEAKSGETVELTRNSEGAWALKQPFEAKAEQGSSEAAASQVMTMRVFEKITKIDPELVGLKDPEYTLTVKFKNGTERTIQIGVVTPTASGYYVQDSAGGDVLIISKSSVDALVGLVTAPPYLETPTPIPSNTGNAIATVTPTP